MSAQRIVITAAIAPLLRSASVAAEQTSQALHGHRLDEIARDGSWLHVRGSDGYAAWMHEGYGLAITAGEERDLFADERVSLGCVARDATGRRALPLGAKVSIDTVLEEGTAISSSERTRQFPVDPASVAETAQKYFEGAPYLWGGVTPWGADCSGMVQTVFALHGVLLPRDSHEQASAGATIAINAESLEDLRPADLLFFSDRGDGRITHIAIATAASSIVHVALGRGGCRREDLRRLDDPYVRALLGRLVRVTRPLAGRS